MSNQNLVSWLLRLGVAFAFLYPAIAAVFDPFSWIGYFPEFMKGYVSDTLLLHAFGFSEAVLALWILSGKKIFIPSVLTSLYLALIVLLNIGQMDVIFRDISILAMSLALAAMSYPNNQPLTPKA
ncbi:MAG: hypothetical protein AAB597_03035 [Patescibacteria group bacterium]